MAHASFDIEKFDPVSVQLSRGWLYLGIAALVASGIFSILLVLSRTPQIQGMIPFLDFFHTALVVHVDLSVLIWFLAFSGAVWSLIGTTRNITADWLALILMTVGTAVIIITPFIGDSHPLMNNYVPVLQTKPFYTGLSLVGVSLAILVVSRLYVGLPSGSINNGSNALQIGIYTSIATTLVTLIAFAWTWATIDTEISNHAFFETLFWGAGHTLQFSYTLLLLAAWLWLAHASGIPAKLSARMATILFLLAASPVIMVPVIQLSFDTMSIESRIWFTQLMRYGGLASIPLGILAVNGFLTPTRATRDQRPLKSSLISSLVLFAAGGIIGFLIQGVNVVIPAHYHGSIVGVTLAFMGLTYYLLPRLGFGKPMPRTAHIQPYVYGAGQLLHILGLAWSGGYGVQRKTAGAAQGLESLPEIAGMALMSLGGLIAIIGGLLFVVVALHSFWHPQNDTNQ